MSARIPGKGREMTTISPAEPLVPVAPLDGEA